MGSARAFGVIALSLAGALSGCGGGGPIEQAMLPAPNEGNVNAPAGGIALVAPNVPNEAVQAFAPFAALFAATYADYGGAYAQAVDATAGEGFTVLDAAALAQAFQGQTRRQFYLETGGGATNRYTGDVVGTAAGGPAWRLESTGGTNYARYSFRTVDGVAQICLDGRASRCGAAFVDEAGTLGVIWERPSGGVTGWVYGPPAGAPAAPGPVAAE
jgi:hypothetical protein